MNQALLGSTTPSWPALSSPVFAWPQAPMPITTAPLAPQRPATPELQTAQPFDWTGLGVAFPLAAGAVTAPLMVPHTVTASALMASVAARRGLPHGPTNDHDVEELLYDAIELLPGASDVEVRCEGGRVTLTGSVPHKRVKHDIGEFAWVIPAITDVQNTLTITGRRRSRAFGRESEQPQASGQSRKQS